MGKIVVEVDGPTLGKRCFNRVAVQCLTGSVWAWQEKVGGGAFVGEFIHIVINEKEKNKLKH